MERYESLVLVAEERVPGPGIAARAGRGRDDGAGRFLILRLEVLRYDSVFLDRVAGARIAATRVLACHATAGVIVFETCPVDEDAYLRGGAAACGERPKGDTVDAIFRDRHPRRDRRAV